MQANWWHVCSVCRKVSTYRGVRALNPDCKEEYTLLLKAHIHALHAQNSQKHWIYYSFVSTHNISL